MSGTPRKSYSSFTKKSKINLGQNHQYYKKWTCLVDEKITQWKNH